MNYRLLEHTADAKFQAWGTTMEEAFAAAVQGMTAIAADPDALGTQRCIPISIRSKTVENLLFDLLDEILFLRDTEKFLPARADALTIAKQNGLYTLDAMLIGDDAKKWPANLKAVTYSEMVVEERPDGSWFIQAVIDI